VKYKKSNHELTRGKQNPEMNSTRRRTKTQGGNENRSVTTKTRSAGSSMGRKSEQWTGTGLGSRDRENIELGVVSTTRDELNSAGAKHQGKAQ
jgi:hypothetical protein